MRLFALVTVFTILALRTVAATEIVSARYDLRWEGLKVGEFSLDLALGESSYAVRYQAQSTGFVDALAGFQSQGSSEGDRTGDDLQARAYRGMSEWRGGGSEWSVRFDEEGRAAAIEIPEDSIGDRGPVPEDLKIAPDPFALALQTILDVAPGAAIEGRSFDGKRAVQYRLQCPDPAGEATREAAGTLECQVMGRLISGGSREWQERNDNQPSAPEPVRLTMERGILEGHYWPVRLATTSRFGDVEIELVEAL